MTLEDPGNASLARMRKVFVSQCQQHAWPASATRCLLVTTTIAGADECFAQLTPQQQLALRNAIEPATTSPALTLQTKTKPAPRPRSKPDLTTPYGDASLNPFAPNPFE